MIFETEKKNISLKLTEEQEKVLKEIEKMALMRSDAEVL